MAKNIISEAVKLAKKLVEILSQGADSGVQMPAPDDVAELEKNQVTEIATAFGIEIEGKKLSEVRALLKTSAQIVADDVEDLEEDEVNALCEAVGVSPSKKLTATITALSEYFDSAKDTEDGEEADADADGDDDDEKPKKGKKEKDEDDGDDDDDEKPKKGKKAKDDDDDDDTGDADGDDEVSDADKAKRLKAYNKVAEKPLKDYAALQKKMTDEEGDAVEWGKAYVKGEEAYCCGLTLETVKKDGKKFGKCQVTGKMFKQDEDGDLVEVEDEDEE